MTLRGQRRLNSSKEEGRRVEAPVAYCNHFKSTDNGGGCGEDIDEMSSGSCCSSPVGISVGGEGILVGGGRDEDETGSSRI